MMTLVQPTGFLPVMPSKTHVLHGSHHRSGPRVDFFLLNDFIPILCNINKNFHLW
jgi:hypothetical protein